MQIEFTRTIDEVSIDASESVLVVNFTGVEESIPIEFTEVLRGEKGDSGSSLVSYTAAVSISGHIAVTLDGSGLLIPADCRTAAHSISTLGVSTNAASPGGTVLTSSNGYLTNPGWGLTIGLPVYLGEAGALVHTVPITALFTKPMGYAISASSILIEIQPAIFLA